MFGSMSFLPPFSNQRKERIVFGRTGQFGFFPKFAVSQQVRNFHTYVVGLTGRGKSKFLQNLIVQDIIAGRGCGVIDPHGDLAKDVLRDLHSKGHFTRNELLNRIVYVAPRRRDYVIPHNVLERPDEETETYEVVQRVIASFMRTWSQSLQEPPRFQQIMRAALACLVETKGTLAELHRLLVDDEFRDSRLDKIPNPEIEMACRTFFEDEFDRWGRDRAVMINSSTNKITALTDNPSLFHMLGHSENKLSLRQLMDAGKVLLVDLGDCDEETKRLIGSLIVLGFEQAALSRSRSQHSDRKPYYLYVDEFQDFAAHPGNAKTFSQMLSQVRKFGLHMILANQSIAQLPTGLQAALGNAQTVISFRIQRADAEVLARVLGKVNTEAIKNESQTEIQHPVYSPMGEQWENFIQLLTNLKVRQAVVKTADDREAVIWSEKVAPHHCSPNELERIIVSLLKKHGVPVRNGRDEPQLSRMKIGERQPIPHSIYTN